MSGHSTHTNDTLVSARMLTQSVAEILKRVHLDRKHDIPYLAGYSLDGSTIYIDRHLAHTFTDHQNRRHKVDKFLVLHEATEKALMDKWGLRYQHAHQIALRAEEAAVRAVGIRWREYDHFMQQWIKSPESGTVSRVPADLDLAPYRAEKDAKLIRVMKQAMHP